MKILIFLLTLFLVFSLISSLSYQLKPMMNWELKKVEMKPELKKIDPELMKIKSFKSQDKVKVIVWLNDKKSGEFLKRIGKVKYQYDIIPAVAMEVPVKELENLAKESNVEKIVPDRIVSAFRTDSIPLIKTDNASTTFSVNGTDINISIIDTGIFNHTEFQSPNRIVKQKCYCSGCCPPDNANEGDNATDDNSHGTHCAGIAAGEGNGNGYGVATNVSLFAVKILNASGTGVESDLIKGIDWAVSSGVNVISLSLGTPHSTFTDCYQSDLALSEAVDNATKQGVVVVASAGNSGPSSKTIGAPGCAKRVITVGNTNDNDNIVSDSSRGPTKDNRTKPDLTAPGHSIYSTVNSLNGYGSKTGTSMSAPHVAGVAALVIQKFNQINGYYPNPDRVKAILITAVNTTGMSSSYEQRNNDYGSGRIDAYEALRIINFTKNDTISTGEEYHYKINVTSADFKTTLYWPEDKDTNNDLNLFVDNGSYNYSYHTDANDSVEQVFFTDASTGYWDVYVVAASGTNQTYYLASNMNITDDVTPPALVLDKPDNTTYTNQIGIPLNFTTDETNHTIWYKLDGGNEVNITGNTTFNVISDGSHHIILYVNDSWNNINQTTRYFSADSTPPIITNQAVDKSLVFLNESVNISANVNGSNVAFALVTITWPDENSTSQNMTNSSSLYYYLFNDTNQTGVYNVLVYVNDTLNNEANKSLSFEVGEAVNVSSQVTNGTTAISVTIKILYNGTDQTRNQTTDTSLDFILPSGLWDVFVNTSQLNVTLYNSNLTQNITRQINITDDILGNFTVNVYAIKTVALKFENFNFSLANLTFDFNSSLVSDTSALEIYKCNDWSFIISNCTGSWVEDSDDTTFNATNTSNSVIVTSSNFSAFSFGETQTTTTTTTTPAPTTVSSSPSSSSGGGGTTTVPSTTTTSTISTTTTTPVTTLPSTTTTISTKKEVTTGKITWYSGKTAWYLALIPAFAIIGLVVWFIFLRKPKESVLEKLKEK